MSIKIKQKDLTDCGAACIASVAGHYKLRLPLTHVRQLASTDKRGTTIKGLLDALGKVGFDARGVRGDLNSLARIPYPAIAHCIVKDSLHHFVVICKVTSTAVRIMDPADGQMHDVPLEEFKKNWSGTLIILIPGERFSPGNKKIAAGARFWLIIRSYKSVFLQAIVGAMVYTIIGLTTSIYVQKLVDFVLVDGNRNLLNLMSLGMIVLLIFQTILSQQRNILTLSTGQQIDIRLILGYYKHLLTLPQQFFDTMRVGEIISRINDAVKIRAFVNEALTAVVVNLFVLIFSFGLMFAYHGRLALIASLVIPLYLLIYFITNRLNRTVERRLMENAAALESELVESLNATGTIKSFGLEAHANLRTEIHFIQVMKSVYSSGINSIFTSVSAEFVSRLFTILLLWIGTGFVLDITMTPGELLSFYALIAYFTGPVSSLTGMNKTIQNALISADRLFEIMDLEPEPEQKQITAPPASTAIMFRSVAFRYGPRREVFCGLDLTIPEHKITAIVGESGSGKSSVVAILQKLYPVEAGHVTIGGVDLRYMASSTLRSLISIVPQKIDLFSGDVVYNIAIGDDKPDMEKILGLCQGLGMMEFIEKLPQGFSTHLGENGALLSGGQRQRIAIARALYKEHRILILDEATSSLDTTSEKHIHRMTSLMRAQDKTVIVIAHRLSTVAHADKIIVLENGKVSEEGSHAELMQREGAYFRLWSDQTAGAMPPAADC